MANATTGPAKGKPYAAIILTGSFTVERENFAAPVDALIYAIRYLREGRQVRLTDRTVSALKEAPELSGLDDLFILAGQPETLAALHALRGVHNGAVIPAVPGA